MTAKQKGIYLHKDGFFVFKIGKTNDKDRRLNEYLTHNYMRKFWHFEPCQNPDKLESNLHKFFAKQRLQREFFRLYPHHLLMLFIIIKLYKNAK